MDRPRAFHGRRERRWVEQHFGNAFLIFERKANNMRLRNAAFRCIPHSRDNEIADAAPVQLGRAAHNGQRFGSNTCF